MNEDRITPEMVIKTMPSIVLELCMRIGVVRGGQGEYLNGFFTPRFEGISYQYSTAYGCVDVLFSYSHYGQREIEVWNCRLVHRSYSISYEKAAESFNQIIQLLIPSVKQKNNLCFCQNHYHKIGKYGDSIDVCYPVGDKWLCRNCINQFSLAESNPEPRKETKQERSERDKMSAALRFKILERDGFTCKSCGRNAREDRVKLHVDHVVAIANGGKTELDNLHTLCQDCNLGKSDKRVEQMEIWG